jgi:quinol monooxygenase YgiN
MRISAYLLLEKVLSAFCIKGEKIMAILMVQHQVKDYETWRTVFDSAAPLRTAAGELTADVYRDAIDPNKVTVLNKWRSMEDAHKFAQSPELMEAMERSGVVGTPSVHFLNEA